MIFLLLIALPVEGKVFEPSTPARYVEALEIANSFLWAWVNRDAETGLMLISHGLLSKLKYEKKEEWFKQYMTSLSNPHHSSFEIASGKEINPKRSTFPVTLYEYCNGEPGAYQYKSKIEVILEGNSWRVDVLPLTADSQENKQLSRVGSLCDIRAT